MRRVAVKIAYLGDEFNGSQIQPTDDNPSIRTVAGEILKNLELVDHVPPEKIDLKFASRTDAGVSALGNVITFYTEFKDLASKVIGGCEETTTGILRLEAMNRDKLMFFDDFDMMKRRISASYEIANAAGCRGMIAGQVADIEAEDKNCSAELLDYIHNTKTAALITGAVRAGARLGGADEEMLEDLTLYAENLGLAFQVADDILDVTGDEESMGKRPGSDEESKKATYPALYGLERSRERLAELTAQAKDALAKYYDNAEFFTGLAEELSSRCK